MIVIVCGRGCVVIGWCLVLCCVCLCMRVVCVCCCGVNVVVFVVGVICLVVL